MRSTLAVIAGYIAMVIVVVSGLFGMYAATGTDWAFKPSSYVASTRWCVGMSAIGLVGGVFGGWLCAKIAPRPGPLKILIALTLIFGAMDGYMRSQKPDAGPREGDIVLMEAGDLARSPSWVLIATPIIGAIGLLIGGRRAFKSA